MFSELNLGGPVILARGPYPVMLMPPEEMEIRTSERFHRESWVYLSVTG